MTVRKVISARDPRRLTDGTGRIACWIVLEGDPEEFLFIGGKEDTEPHAQEILRRVEAGEFGEVLDISPAESADLPQGYSPTPIGSFARSSTPPPAHWSEMDTFLAEINQEVGRGSDRGYALTSTAMVETLVHRLVITFLVDEAETQKLLFSTGGLGEFAVRCRLAQALGLIAEPLTRRLLKIGKLRNIFAHQVGARFETQSIRDAVLALLDQPGPVMQSLPTRILFGHACMQICLQLATATASAERDRRKPPASA